MRSSRILAEIRDLRAESNLLIAEVRSEFGLNREMFRSEIVLNREVIRRNERVMSELVEAVREMRDQVRAQTRAIFKLIDRLDGGTSSA